MKTNIDYMKIQKIISNPNNIERWIMERKMDIQIGEI